MKKSFTILIPSFLVLLLTSCGSSPESLTEDMIGEVKAMTEILKGVESKEDFESAKDDLEGHKKKIEELKKKMESMEKELSEEDKKKLKEKNGKELAGAFMEFFGAAIKAAAYGFEMPDMK